MIATPSASSTTPISSGTAFADGPMNIVTSGSSVSNPRQWCRSAWSMSSSKGHRACGRSPQCPPAQNMDSINSRQHPLTRTLSIDEDVVECCGRPTHRAGYVAGCSAEVAGIIERGSDAERCRGAGLPRVVVRDDHSVQIKVKYCFGESCRASDIGPFVVDLTGKEPCAI